MARWTQSLRSVITQALLGPSGEKRLGSHDVFFALKNSTFCADFRRVFILNVAAVFNGANPYLGCPMWNPQGHVTFFPCRGFQIHDIVHYVNYTVNFQFK